MRYGDVEAIITFPTERVTLRCVIRFSLGKSLSIVMKIITRTGKDKHHIASLKIAYLRSLYRSIASSDNMRNTTETNAQVNDVASLTNVQINDLALE